MLSTGLLITAATMTGKIDQASLQSVLYKIGYFVFLAVFLVAVLLSLRVALLQRDMVKPSHLTVSFHVSCTSQFTHVYQKTHADHSADCKVASHSVTLSRPAHNIWYARHLQGHRRQHVHVHVELAVWLGHGFCAHGAFARVHHSVYIPTYSAFQSQDV
jgi:hypothetical protein